ncbi:MAG: tRNA (guanosine(46)-N7)-methyltransferase TrmB [Chloroflexota bacterium]
MSLVGEFVWHTVAQLPWPADWSALMGRQAPLLIEIGFGNGLFLVDLARRRRDANVVGVEISLPSMRHAARKVRRAGLTNVILIKDSAAAILQALCRPQSIDAVIINFPDPWPKKGHEGRRLINDNFLHLLATRLIPGGTLDIATDHVEYAAQTGECLHRSPHFESRIETLFTYVGPDRPRTKYEQLALAENRPPHYFKWRRNHISATANYPVPRELPMPHVVIRTPLDLSEFGREFRPQAIEVSGVRIKFLEVYQSFHDGALVVETYINEDPIVQRVGLELRPRASGEIVIALHDVGFPRPTWGVHLAIRTLLDLVQARYPATVIVHSTVREDYADD